MATFCIPKKLAANLKEAAVRGEINMVSLYEMSSNERREFFKKYTDEETAKGINAGFERAISSSQKTALKNWAERTFTGSDQRKKVGKNVIDKINTLVADNVLTPETTQTFYADMIADDLGITITPEEASTISKMAKELETEYKKGVNEFNLPSVEYFKKRDQMEKYLSSLTPASNLRIITSTIFRGNLLFNIKSSVTNLVGNSVQGIGKSLARRIGSGQYSGAGSKELVNGYYKYALDVYKQTGYDVTRMYDLSETGQKTLGEEITHSQGQGIIRATGRFYEDYIFKAMLGTPDVAFSAATFIDSANLSATKLAKSEGLSGAALTQRVDALLKDATAIKPLSMEGQAIRDQAIADAQVATFQDKTRYTALAMGLRSVFNSFSGDLRLGDQIMPFAKTPANVIGAGLDAGGLAMIQGIYELPAAIKESKSGNPEPLQSVAKRMAFSGLGLTIAFIISAAFEPDDFIGEYPTTDKERELLKLKGATTNSLKIGNKWVSLDYFGFLGAPLVGFLYARKYGENLPDSIFRYMQGVAVQSVKIPGIESTLDTLGSLKDIAPDKDNGLGKNIAGVISGATDFLVARTTPGIMYDIAKALDTVERTVDYSDPMSIIKNRIPIWRKSLTPKVDIFGEVLRGEPAWSTVLFGARVKTVRESAVIDEMQRLYEANELPALTNPNKNARVKDYKSQVDQEKYDKMLADYYDEFKKKTEKLVDSNKYKRLADDEKKAAIEKEKSDALDKALKKARYKKTKK